MLLDLHAHSIATPHHSHWQPEPFMRALNAANISVAAITDHNTTAQVANFMLAAQNAGIHLISGVELDSAFRGKLWHTLVYGVDPNEPALLHLCNEVVRRNHADAQHLITRMRDHAGFMDALERIAVNRAPNLADVAHACVRAGIWPQHAGVEDEAAGMAHLLTHEPALYNPLDVAEIIEVAHRHDGVAILAHPGREKSVYAIPANADDVAALVAVGLDGLEVYYPKHSPERTAFLRQQAEQHDLLVTAGGDSHGPNDPFQPRPLADCAAFLARFGIKNV